MADPGFGDSELLPDGLGQHGSTAGGATCPIFKASRTVRGEPPAGWHDPRDETQSYSESQTPTERNTR